MLAIWSGLEILPARTCAGSPPTQLNRMKISRITPKMVGIICQILRITYAVISTPSSPRGRLLHGGLLGGHVDVEPLVVGIQDRVLLVSLHPRILQVVELARDPQAPRGIGKNEPRHLPVQAV